MNVNHLPLLLAVAVSVMAATVPSHTWPLNAALVTTCAGNAHTISARNVCGHRHGYPVTITSKVTVTLPASLLLRSVYMANLLT